MADALRLKSLDGLRGLAALAVVAEHSLLTFPVFWAAFNAPAYAGGLPPLVSLLTFTPLHIFWSGGAAVKIFFVLSGLVLSLPFWNGKAQNLLTYVVRRVFRIYPVYLFSILLSIILLHLVHVSHVPTASSWFNRYWQDDLTAEAVTRALLFLPGDFLAVNTPLWTLIHEMRISLVFPAIIWAMSRRPLLTLSATVVFSFLAKALMTSGAVHNADLLNLLDTASQVWLFVIGAFIAKNLACVRDWAARCAPAQQVLLVIAAILLLLLRWIAPAPSAVVFFATGLGATLLIVLSAASPAMSRMLEMRFPHFAGAISYSLYAIHFPLIVAAIHLLPVPQPAAVLAGIFTAAVAATLLNRWLEVPLTDLGRNLTMVKPPARGATPL